MKQVTAYQAEGGTVHQTADDATAEELWNLLFDNVSAAHAPTNLACRWMAANARDVIAILWQVAEIEEPGDGKAGRHQP